MPRRFAGQRALRIAFRTAHLASIAVLIGAALFTSDAADYAPAAIATGSLLAGAELYRYGLDWLRWLQSWVVLAKLTLLTVGMLRPELLTGVLWACLILGAVVSHAPGSVRQWPIWGPPGPCARRPAPR